MNKLKLSNGEAIQATISLEEKPCIMVWLELENGTRKLLCFVEYEKTTDQTGDVVIAAYNANHEEPVFYQSYYTA